MKKSLFLIMGFLISLQAAFCADEALSSDLANSLKAHPAEPGFFSIVFALVFVVCLIYVTGLIYSKLNIIGANTVKKQLKNYDLSHVVVLSTTQLGQNKNLHVVEVNKKKFLIGATPNSINLVKELGESDVFETSEVGVDLKEELPSDSNEINKSDFFIEGISAENKEDVEEVEEFSLHKKYL